MSIQVLFFGFIADRLGEREASLSEYEGMTIENIVHATGCADLQPLLVAVNQVQVNDMSVVVNDGDEVALMPPFSGG